MRVKLWQILLFAPVYVWLTWDSYTRVSRWEHEGGTIYLNKLDAALVRMGGAKAVLIFWGSIGLVYAFGIARFILWQRKLEAQAEARTAPRPEPKPEPKFEPRPVKVDAAPLPAPEKRLSEVAPPDDPSDPRFLR